MMGGMETTEPWSVPIYSLLKKIVLNLIRMDKTEQRKGSLRLKRKRAAWDDDLRMSMLGLQSL
jgi:hypothetical protein